MTTIRGIRTALARNGIEPQARLRSIKDRIITDGDSLVVKLTFDQRAAQAYIRDLQEHARVGVPAEKLLLNHPLAVGDRWAVAVAFVRPIEATQAHHAGDVGRLIRLTHDRVWPQMTGEVYCPDDWRPDNIIITANGPVMVDLDLAGLWPRARAVAVAIDDFSKPFGQRQRQQIAAALLGGYGDHPDLSPRGGRVPPQSTGGDGAHQGP